jgi:protein phosphatase 1L
LLSISHLFSASQNGKFSYGYASSPGKRASMEDFYETKIDCVDGQIIGLFGVFDGTGLPQLRMV